MKHITDQYYVIQDRPNGFVDPFIEPDGSHSNIRGAARFNTERAAEEAIVLYRLDKSKARIRLVTVSLD